MASHTRITSQFKPDEYSLDLSLDLSSKQFSGELQITGHRRSHPSYRITLHQVGLKIDTAQIFRVEKGYKTEVPITRIVHHKKRQELRLHSSEQIKSAKYIIKLKYSGKVARHGISGMYLSYTDISGLDSVSPSSQQEIITTQFQPHYARTLLPCIDEPEAKAIFNFNLDLTTSQSPNPTFLQNNEVIFNTLPISDKFNEATNSRVLKFNPTPKMSTYLLALTVGDLACKKVKTKSGVLIRAFTTEDKIEDSSFALDFAQRVLDFLEELFKFKYPLKKLDLVAVPDFDAGGMENWGAISFREELLLFDEAIATLADKQSIAQTVAHEISHQWFGNLVTMKWWDEIWLNEGFANFMELFLVDKFFPDWKVFEENLVTSRSGAIRLDSLPSSKAIVKKVRCAHHVEQAFDTVAYEKSSNVIRMVFHLLGEESFFKGLSVYFNKFKFANASSSDLIACWQPFSSLNLSEFLESWLHKPGLPLVTASVDKDGKSIILAQSKFNAQLKLSESFEDMVEAKVKKALSEKPHLGKKQKIFYENNIRNRLNKEKNRLALWQIPIDFIEDIDQDGTEQYRGFLMKKESHKIRIAQGGMLPVKLNKGANNFYIVGYSLEFLAQISRSISSGRMQHLEILNLLTDAISLNRAGQFEPGSAAILNIVEAAIENNVNPNFWALVGGFIAYIHYHLKYSHRSNLANLEALEKYVCNLISEVYPKVGTEGQPTDDFQLTSLRFEILSLAALAKDRKLLLGLGSEFKRYCLDFEKIDPEKRMLVLYAVAKEGLIANYEKILQLYRQNLEDVTLRDDLAYGLCCFEAEKFVKSNLKILQEKTLVRSQDVVSWVAMLVNSSKLGSRLVLNWVTKQDGWSWLELNLSPNDLSVLISILFSTIFSPKDLNRLQDFILQMKNPELQKVLDESVEIANSRIDWHRRELTAVVEYLSQK